VDDCLIGGGVEKPVLRLYLVVPGILLGLAGFVFTLQGLGIVGPTTSFMFQSSTWVHDGAAILVVGVLLILLGVWPRAGKKG
jgi:hypothetical protein